MADSEYECLVSGYCHRFWICGRFRRLREQPPNVSEFHATAFCALVGRCRHCTLNTEIYIQEEEIQEEQDAPLRPSILLLPLGKAKAPSIIPAVAVTVPSDLAPRKPSGLGRASESPPPRWVTQHT